MAFNRPIHGATTLVAALCACNPAQQRPPGNPAHASAAQPSPSADPSPTAQPVVPLSLGARAQSQDVGMLGVDGRQTTIESVTGERGTLVIFTANHCPWAQAWESRVTALGNEFGALGVGVIAVNSNDPAKYSRALYEKMAKVAAATNVNVEFSPDDFPEMQRRARAAGMQFPYVVDATSQVARSFGATRTPEVFLFDGDGQLAYHGAIDDNAFAPDQVQHHFLRDALQAVVADSPVPHAQSPAIGCAIAFRGPA